MTRKSATGKPAKAGVRKSRPHAGAGANPGSKGTGPQSVHQGVQWVTVDEDNQGQRVDNFLLAQLRGVPRSIIYRIVRKGEVRVNKGRVRPDTRLATGDQVRIPPVVRKSKARPASPGSRVQSLVEAAVVFENDQMLVVNKPSGMAVHGGSGLSFGLIEALRAARPGVRFLELVHRLDRDTSGLVMVAKKRSALRYLQDELRQRRIYKQYHALVAGDWPERLERVDEPLLRYEMSNGERRVKVDDAGKSSLTVFRCLSRCRGYTLVDASPITGRTHQIRVHSACAGHPIAGDDKYMDNVSLKAFRSIGGQRLMLHARALELALPATGERARFEAPYDEAFSQVLGRLEMRAAGAG